MAIDFNKFTKREDPATVPSTGGIDFSKFSSVRPKPETVVYPEGISQQPEVIDIPQRGGAISKAFKYIGGKVIDFVDPVFGTITDKYRDFVDKKTQESIANVSKKKKVGQLVSYLSEQEERGISSDFATSSDIVNMSDEQIDKLYTSVILKQQGEREGVVKEGIQSTLFTGGRLPGEIVGKLSKGKQAVSVADEIVPEIRLTKVISETAQAVDEVVPVAKKIDFDKFTKKAPTVKKADEFVKESEEVRKLDQMKDKVIHLTDSNEYIPIPKNFTKEQRIKLFDEVANIPTGAKRVIHISDPKVAL